MDRAKMRDALIKDVENWELCDLIEWARKAYWVSLRNLSDKQFAFEYATFIEMKENSNEDLEV